MANQNDPKNTGNNAGRTSSAAPAKPKAASGLPRKPAGKDNAAKQKPESACILIGNVGTNPEMRFTPGGKPATNIRLAVYAGSKVDPDSNQKKPETSWFTLTFWGDLAENVNQNVAQGMKLRVGGNSPVVRQWQGRDELVHAEMEMTAWEYTIVPSQSELAGQQQGQA